MPCNLLIIPIMETRMSALTLVTTFKINSNNCPLTIRPVTVESIRISIFTQKIVTFVNIED